jgi:hypothetical protein
MDNQSEHQVTETACYQCRNNGFVIFNSMFMVQYFQEKRLPLRSSEKSCKTEAIPAILNERNSSPFNLKIFPSQVPVDPVTCTKGASGPKLPPDATQNKEERIMDGLFFGSSFPLLNLMLLTIRWISPDLR